MIVAITSRDTFEPTLVEVDDFHEVASTINTAAANGKALSIFTKEDGDPVAVYIQNITRIEGIEDAFIG